MLTKSIILVLIIIQVLSIRIPSRYLKSLLNSEDISNSRKVKILKTLLRIEEENISDNRTDPKPDNRTDNRTDPKPDNRTDNRTDPKPDNRTDNRTDPKPDNRTDNRTDPKPDNRTDNRTDPKPDNRTDNRTDPKPDNRTDNRTDPKPDNRTDNKTYNAELVGVNTNARELTPSQNISLIFKNEITNFTLIKNIIAFTKNRPYNKIPLKCIEKESKNNVLCIGDFSIIPNGIYTVKYYEYNNTLTKLTYPITFYVQKKSRNLR